MFTTPLTSPLTFSMTSTLGLNAALVPINGVRTGQSLMDRYSGTTFLAALPSGSLLADSAVGGKPRTKTAGDYGSEDYWINDDDLGNMSDGPLFTSHLSIVDSGYDNRTDVNVITDQIWNSERFRVTEDGTGSGNMTIAHYKTVTEHFYNRIWEEHGADTYIVVGIPHRRTSNDAGELYGAQKIREMYLDIIAADDRIIGVDYLHLGLADSTHLDTAGEDAMGTLLAEAANHLVNGTPAPDQPYALTASIDVNEVTINMSGDITPPSAGVGQVAAEQNGVEKTGSALIRTAANTLKFTLGDNQGVRTDDSPYLRISSNTNHTLNASAPDCLMNADDTLCARASRVALTDTNIIHNTDSVIERVNAKHSTKTLDGSNNMTLIEGLYGDGFEEHPNATNTPAVYDAALEGFKCVTGSECMQNITGFVADSDKTFVFVATLPDPAVGTRIFTFGLNDGASHTSASLYCSGSGLRYARDEVGAYPTLVADHEGGKHVIAMRYNSNGSLDIFFDSTTVTVNIDPNDAFSIYDTIHMFARGGATDGLQGCVIHDIVIANDAIPTTDAGATDLAEIITNLGTLHSVTIS